MWGGDFQHTWAGPYFDTYVHAYFERYTHYSRSYRPTYYRTYSTSGMMCADELCAGDVLLFSRVCALMSPCARGLCLSAKLFGGSDYDHVALVVRAPSGALLVLEANAGGVTLRPLADRLARSRALMVSVRRLSVRGGATPEEQSAFEELLWRAAQRRIGANYCSSPVKGARAVLSSHMHHATHSHAIVARHVRLARTRALLAAELSAVDQHSLLSRILALRIAQLDTQLGLAPLPMSSLADDDDSSGPAGPVNCSNLVGELLLGIGVLLPLSPARLFLPADFSSACALPLPLHPRFALSPDLPLLGETKDNLVMGDGDALSMACLASGQRAQVLSGRVLVLDARGRLVQELEQGQQQQGRPEDLSKGSLVSVGRSVVSLSSSAPSPLCPPSPSPSPLTAPIARELMAALHSHHRSSFTEGAELLCPSRARAVGATSLSPTQLRALLGENARAVTVRELMSAAHPVYGPSGVLAQSRVGSAREQGDLSGTVGALTWLLRSRLRVLRR